MLGVFPPKASSEEWLARGPCDKVCELDSYGIGYPLEKGGMERRKVSCLIEGSIGIEFREMTAVKRTLERSKEQF